jgi:hypothetical protein
VDIYPINIGDELDRYAPGFREAEQAGHGLAIGYDLERILAQDGGPLKIIVEIEESSPAGDSLVSLLD